MTSLEKKIKNLISKENHFDPHTSFKICALLEGRKKVEISLGPSYTYYDLSSLTKVIFTTGALMDLCHQKKLRLSSFVKDFIPCRTSCRLQDLLSHQTNLNPVMAHPYFLLKYPVEKRWERLQKYLLESPFHKTSKASYSDVGFLHLRSILEKLYQKPLKSIWEEFKNEKNLKKLHFNSNEKRLYERKEYAPTYRDYGKFKKDLKGEVHDELSSLLGGLSSHAGLFSDMDSLIFWFHLLRNSLKNIQPFLTSSSIFKKICLPVNESWRSGFMRPTQPSSSGQFFSPYSIGHLGYTGTSFWWDMKKDISVFILTHRMKNNVSLIQNLRPKIHDDILKEFF